MLQVRSIPSHLYEIGFTFESNDHGHGHTLSSNSLTFKGYAKGSSYIKKAVNWFGFYALRNGFFFERKWKWKLKTVHEF